MVVSEQKILSDDFVNEELAFWHVPGISIAAGRGGETIFAKGYGERDVERHLPMTPDTLGGIASCSKSFCAAAAASLVQEGKLSFDEPIRNYIPDFALMDPVASAECTIRDMLYHRTGLAAHDAMWPQEGLSRREYLRKLRFLEPNQSFRSAAQYNNTVYNAIGCILEEVSGEKYEDLVRERILEPLRMPRTVLSAADMQRDSNHAEGYFGEVRTAPLTRMPAWEMGVGVPAAGVCASPDEMMNWLSFQAHGGVFNGKQLLSKELMDEMHAPAVPMRAFPWHAPQVTEIPEGAFYGMAWKSASYRDLTLRYHCGEIEGYCSVELYVPGRDLYLFAFCNRHCPNTPVLMELAYTVIDHVLGYPETDWAGKLHPYERIFEGSCADWKLDLLPENGRQGTGLSHPLEDYAGTYENPAYGKYTVLLKDGSLLLQYKNWFLPMEHYHYDTFRIRNLKMDTLFVTLPLTYTYNEVSGQIDGFGIKLEPEVKPIRFIKTNGEDGEN